MERPTQAGQAYAEQLLRAQYLRLGYRKSHSGWTPPRFAPSGPPRASPQSAGKNWRWDPEVRLGRNIRKKVEAVEKLYLSGKITSDSSTDARERASVIDQLRENLRILEDLQRRRLDL